jgi:hypothetical protein
MAESMQVRPVEQRVVVVYCDRCGKEIHTKRRDLALGLDRLEGATVTARGNGKWVPLIPLERASAATHTREFHAANVDLCGLCTEELQEWFRSGASFQDDVPASRPSE